MGVKLKRYFLYFSYKGTNYHGWQKQNNAHTVQAELENALFTILREEIAVTGAGRTDAGVHAKYMVAHFDCSSITDDKEKFVGRLNRVLPVDIAITKIIEVKSDAHARFDALSRTYRYYISFKKNPFSPELFTSINFKLDIDLMNKAASLLLEISDFASFCKLHSNNKNTLSTVTYAKWEEINNSLIFTITANRFLRDMVRSIVGTLIDVGRKKISIADFQKIINSKDRREAGMSAPANGLFLEKIEYPKTILL